MKIKKRANPNTILLKMFDFRANRVFFFSLLIFHLFLIQEAEVRAKNDTPSKEDILKVWNTFKHTEPKYLKIVTTYQLNSGISGEYSHECKVAKDSALYITEDGEGGAVAEGWNSDYWFRVRRRKESPSWFLEEVGVHPLPPSYEKIKRIIDNEMNKAFCYRGQNVKVLLIDSGFKVEELVVDSNDQDLIQINFSYDPSLNIEAVKGDLKKSGTMWLSRMAGYAVAKYRDEDYEVERTGFLIDGKYFAVPEEAKQTWLGTGDIESYQSIVSTKEINLADFRLPAFGIIEPDFLIKRSLASKAILPGVAIVILILVGFFFY